jgi:HK97 family phage portal protein
MMDYGWALGVNQDRTKYADIQLYYEAGKNDYVSTCVNTYYEAVLNNGFEIVNMNESEPVEVVRYVESLFKHPCGLFNDETYAKFVYKVARSYWLTGDAFIEVSYENINNKQILNGFKYIPPELMMYYHEDKAWGFVNDDKVRFSSDELIHIHRPSCSKNDVWGESIIDNIGLAISLMFEGLKYNKDFFKQAGVDPNRILSFDKDTDNISFEEEVSRLYTQIKENRRGTLITKGLNVLSMSHEKDLDYLELIHLSRDLILHGFGVPPALAGVVEIGNLSADNIKSQISLFTLKYNAFTTIICDEFNRILKRSGFRVEFKINPFDTSDVREDTELDVLNVNNGILTINEVREARGLEPVAWGDTPPAENLFTVQTEDAIGTGDSELDKALYTVRKAESRFYDDIEY